MTPKTKFSFQIISHLFILLWHFYIHYPTEFLQPGTHKTRQLSDYDIFQTTRQYLSWTKSIPLLFGLHT
jgi:hypothetical protein